MVASAVRLLRDTPRRAIVLMSAALVLAGGSGFLASQALGVGTVSPRTITISVATGPRGPQGEPGPRGPQGEQGPKGDPGASACPTGFSAAFLTINHPGGHVTIWTCVEQ